MILNRTARMRVPMTLATIAVIALVVGHHRAYAQSKARTRVDKRTGATAGRGNKKAQPRVKPRRSSAIPEPTVVLHPGEVPIIKFDSSVFDFGRVRAGTPVKHEFVFKNTGNGTLEILKAKAG